MRISDCGLPNVDFGLAPLRIADFRLWIEEWGFPIAECGLRNADWENGMLNRLENKLAGTSQQARAGDSEPENPQSAIGNPQFAIRVRDLSKRYGPIQAVRGISFDVGEKEIFGLIGPDGAGKTTAYQIL